jgi:hypothetical protein
MLRQQALGCFGLSRKRQPSDGNASVPVPLAFDSVLFVCDFLLILLGQMCRSFAGCELIAWTMMKTI